MWMVVGNSQWFLNDQDIYLFNDDCLEMNFKNTVTMYKYIYGLLSIPLNYRKKMYTNDMVNIYGNILCYAFR